MAVDPLKNKKILDKSTNFRSKSFFWCSRYNSVEAFGSTVIMLPAEGEVNIKTAVGRFCR
jgi:hypothetical protein